MANIKTFNSPDELWNELGLKDDEPWNEFKKRMLHSPNKSIVYEREGRKMLNIYACRGFKRMLTEGGKVTRKRWNEILGYFLPIIHKERNKYATNDSADDEPEEGFTLSNIAATLNCPAFLGPASDDDCRKSLSEKQTPGEHCFRFSSSKGQFVMHLLGDDRVVAAYKIYPVEKTHKLFLAFKNAREEFKTLAELEARMPEWKTKFGVPFIPKKSEEFETLDGNEKTLLEWLQQHTVIDLYPTVIRELSLKMEWEESLEGLKLLKDDPNFQASISAEVKEKIENAFKEDEDEKSKSGKVGKPVKPKKKVVKKKEKVLV